MDTYLQASKNMHWILAKIALFIAIIWVPTQVAVIPPNTPIQVASSTVPHVIIKAMPTENNSQQNADNQPLLGVEAPIVTPNLPEVNPNTSFMQVAPGPVGTPVQEPDTVAPQVDYKIAGPDVGGHYNDAGVPFTGFNN